MPAIRPVKFCVVAPVLHEYVNGEVPPATPTLMLPLLKPKHETSADADTEAANAPEGCEIFLLIV